MPWARLIVVALLACSPASRPPDCVSSCGMQEWGTFDCAGLDRTEALAITTFAELYPPDRACSALRGWWLGIHDGNPARTWVDGESTLLPTGSWGRDGYAHELAHVLDWQLNRVTDYACAQWPETRPELYQAILVVNRGPAP